MISSRPVRRKYPLRFGGPHGESSSGDGYPPEGSFEYLSNRNVVEFYADDLLRIHRSGKTNIVRSFSASVRKRLRKIGIIYYFKPSPKMAGYVRVSEWALKIIRERPQ